MDFNIKKILERKKQQNPEYKNKQICCACINKHDFHLQPKHISFQKQLLVLQKVDPHTRTRIKIRKKEILTNLSREGFMFRDIL